MVFDNIEYCCSVCGLPCRRLGGRVGEILDDITSTQYSQGVDQKLVRELQGGAGWLDQVRLLCDPDDEVGHLIPTLAYENLEKPWQSTAPEPARPRPQAAEIEEYPAEQEGGPFFHRRHRHGYVGAAYAQPCQVNVDYWDFPTADGRAYIPVHVACLEMAKRVIRTSSNRFLNSMRGFWTALRWRHGMTHKFKSEDSQANYMLAPRHWYHPNPAWLDLPYGAGQVNEKWRGPSGEPAFNIYHVFLCHPIEVPRLTEVLLRNLKECPSHEIPDGDLGGLRGRLEALPQDVFDLIVAQLRSCRDLPLLATHILPQTFWKSELMLGGGSLLPWLWDVDRRVIDAKARRSCPGGAGFEWNWELLVRQLSRGVDAGMPAEVPRDEHFEYRGNYTSYYDELKHVPAGLHNRRRIWQLLEEMFVGDKLPVVGKQGDSWFRPRHQEVASEECAQMHWTKGGDVKPHPTWIPSINMDEPFIHEIGGGIYRKIPRPGEEFPLQYWQIPKPNERPHGGDDQIERAPVEEILSVIHRLGYPA